MWDGMKYHGKGNSQTFCVCSLFKDSLKCFDHQMHLRWKSTIEIAINASNLNREANTDYKISPSFFCLLFNLLKEPKFTVRCSNKRPVVHNLTKIVNHKLERSQLGKRNNVSDEKLVISFWFKFVTEDARMTTNGWETLPNAKHENLQDNLDSGKIVLKYNMGQFEN